MTQLSATDINHYRERGYVIPPFQLPADRTQAMRQALDELIAANPGVRPEKLVSAHTVAKGGAANAEGVRGHAAFADLAREPAILDMVEQLIGPDIILWGCHVFCKPAHEGYETPWHQDGHYWPMRPLATCTVWVAIEESTRENGCLRVIPGSHTEKITHPHLMEDRNDLTLNLRTDETSFDVNSAMDLELQPGQMSMHDVFLIHGAAANTSGKRRTGVALRYMPATSVFERNLNPVNGQSGVPVAFAKRPIWLLRGRDQTGRNDFTVGHDALA